MSNNKISPGITARNQENIELGDLIDEAINKISDSNLQRTNERSIAITKLQEARMWLRQDYRANL